MALSGTIEKSITGRTYRIEWSATQSIANNTSTITCNHYLDNNPSYSLYVSAGNVSTCNVGGVEKSFTNPAISTGGGTTHHLGTTVHTVSHNSDGTKSVTIKGSYNISATLSGSWTPSIIAEGTITLNQIPRTSGFAVSKTSADMGTSVTFTIDRASTALTHKLLLTWGGETSTIASNVGASYAWTIPLSLASDLPSSLSSGCIITCETYSGSNKLGQATLSMVISVPASVKPSISSVTISEAVTTVKDKIGAYLQNQSKLNVKITASGAYSSTITNYSTKILNKTYNGDEFTSNTITSSGTVSVEVTVTDSRGRTATSTKSVTVTPYSGPTITTFTAERCNSDGSANDDGEYAMITVDASVTPLNNKNSAGFTLRYKAKGDNAYIDLGTVTDTYDLYFSDVLTNVLSIDESYSFTLIVADDFTSISYTVDLTTGFTLVDYHASGKGMSIGKVAEKEDTLEVALDAEFSGTMALRGNRYAFSSPGVAGSNGYILMAQLKHLKANADTPITFIFTRRLEATPMTVHVQFASNSTTVDPALKGITYEGSNYGAYLVKLGASTWGLYIQKVSAYDTVTLQDWYSSATLKDRLDVTFPGTLVDEVPDPYYRATPAKLRSLLDHIYPVGSIYISYTHTSPADFFGGTWARLENTVLWASPEGGNIGSIMAIQTPLIGDDYVPATTVSIWRRTA